MSESSEIPKESRMLTVLFGSQTGSAEEVAERIRREAKRRHFICKIFALDDFEIANLINQRLVVFVVSTTGQGDPPDNMKKFWKFLLRKNLPSESLQNVHVAVFGLGDSSYQKFNFIAKKLFRRLMQLGANSIVSPGYGDDQHDLGVDGSLDPWLLRMWETVLRMYPLPPGKEIIPSNVRPLPRFAIEIMDEIDGREKIVETCSTNSQFSRETPYKASVISNERLTSPDHWQDVRLVKFDISGSGICYNPGDVVMIQPENLPNVVEKFASLLNINTNTIVQVSKRDPDRNLPMSLQEPVTMYELLKKYFDIQAVPKRYFFELLSLLTTSEMERERLAEFATAEGQEELYDYCYRTKRNYYEVFEDFPISAANVPLEYLFDLVPAMKPRAFSIASCQLMHQNEIHILMAVVKYRTKLLLPRLGVCSNWLASFNKNSEKTVPLWVADGTIRLPKNVDAPIVMIGPGTGVAPFKAFIEHRMLGGSKENVLFFGSRNKDKDFFFENEWKALQIAKCLQLHTAFSRDQDEKIYVQHRLQEQSRMVWDLIDGQNCIIYIAGNAKDMPTGVLNCLKEIISEYGKLSEEQAEQYLKGLENCKRLQCETWS